MSQETKHTKYFIGALVVTVFAVTVGFSLGGKVGLMSEGDLSNASLFESDSQTQTESSDATGWCTPVELEDGTFTECPSPHSSVTASIGKLHKLDPNCPAPTINKGGQCVLEQDVVLTNTLDLASLTKLNCQGHKLTPSVLGVRDNTSTPAQEFAPSVPSLAVLMNGAHGVKLQNCNIDGFDHGIIILNNKINGNFGASNNSSNKILNNTVNANYGGVAMIDADNNEIKDNAITVAAGNSIGIFRDSDSNAIKNNVVSNTETTVQSTQMLPGVPVTPFNVAGGSTNPPAICAPCNYIPFFDLTNFVIDGVLYQSPVTLGSADHNVAEGNTVGINLFNKSGIIVRDKADGNIVRGNTITATGGGGGGILVVGIAGNVSLPGMCSLDASRACLTDADCNIASFGNVGTCSGVTSVAHDRLAKNTLVENNTISGPWNNGLNLQYGDNTQVLGNTVTGASSTTAALGNAIQLSSRTVENATISRNILTGNRGGFRFIIGGGTGPAATVFGAKISLNDIVGSTVQAIRTQAYALSTELSVLVKGNYWGRTCNDSDGFREFGSAGADSPNAAIVDSHPYGVSVATTQDGSLPPTCL